MQFGRFKGFFKKWLFKEIIIWNKVKQNFEIFCQFPLILIKNDLKIMKFWLNRPKLPNLWKNICCVFLRESDHCAPPLKKVWICAGSKKYCAAQQKYLHCIEYAFGILSRCLAHFLNFWHTFSYLWHTFSAFGTLSHTFSTFGTLSQFLAHFLILSQLFAHFLKFWHTFSYFL